MSYALLDIVKNIFVRNETAETKPEPETEPDHRISIRIKRWVTRERKEIRGIWVTRVKLEQMEQLNLLTNAIVMDPYYGLASQPFVVEGRT